MIRYDTPSAPAADRAQTTHPPSHVDDRSVPPVSQPGTAHGLHRVLGNGALAALAEAGADTVRRSVISAGESTQTPPSAGERPAEQGRVEAVSLPRAAGAPRPETCPPPADIACPPSGPFSGAIINTLLFSPAGSALLDATQRAEIDFTAAAWRIAESVVALPVRVDGYASAEAGCEFNWRLSCRRAQVIAAELERPSDGSPGIPTSNITIFAHGESDEAGPVLGLNRRATISMPT
ncbi:MAG: OmpA family protein, partial [Pseudonocardiaceae bacterium]